MEGSVMIALCFFTLLLTATTDAQNIVFPVIVTLGEGDACTMHSGTAATCTDIRNCDYTNLDLRNNPPVRCGFNGIFPVVCCPAVQREHPQAVTDIAPPTLPFQCGRNSRHTFTLTYNHLDDGRKIYAELEDYSSLKIYNQTSKLENGTEVLSEVAISSLGSERTEKNVWPWMALLGERKGKDISWFCGGVLINEEWVLSALHCFFNNNPEVVRLGEHNYKDDNDGATHQDFRVAETVMYPGYTHPEAYHGLALLRLARRVPIQKFISPVCLPWGAESEVDITDSNATLTGYGDTQYGGIPTSYLQEVNVTVLSSAQCDHRYSNLSNYAESWPYGIGKETLCAGDPNGGRYSCQGDSGGPIVSQDGQGHFVLAGIVSQGHGCGHEDYPGLYANLRHPPYLAWIKKVAFTAS